MEKRSGRPLVTEPNEPTAPAMGYGYRVPIGFPRCDLKPGEEKEVVAIAAGDFHPEKLIVAPTGKAPRWYRAWAKVLRFFFIKPLDYVENPEWSLNITSIRVDGTNALVGDSGVTSAIFNPTASDCAVVYPNAVAGNELRIGLRNIGKRPLMVFVSMLGSSPDPIFRPRPPEREDEVAP